MEIQEETINGITVLTLDGEVDSSTALSLQEAVEAYINPHCRILMNLAGVGYMSSAGLRVMLVTYRDVIAQEGRIVLLHLSEEIRYVMEATGFLSHFTLADSFDEGIALLENGHGSAH